MRNIGNSASPSKAIQLVPTERLNSALASRVGRTVKLVDGSSVVVWEIDLRYYLRSVCIGLLQK